MEEKQWTEQDLAERMGVSYTTVYRVLRDQRGPGNEFIARLLAVTEGLSFDDLFTRVQPLPDGNKPVAQASRNAATA